jgi:hypothetical protein
MRVRIRLAAIVVAFACLTGVARAGGGPGAVYNDFAQDGKLSCNHSRADLEAVLRSGSLNQYGDPLTLARLKLAVRKQLAGGCRRTTRSRQTGGAGGPGGGTAAGGTTAGRQKPGSSKGSRKHSRTGSSTFVPPSKAASGGGDNASFVASRGLIIGLLIAALAFGGWLTKHALAARD